MRPKQAAPMAGGQLPIPRKVAARARQDKKKASDTRNLMQKRPLELSLDLYDTGANYQMLHVFHRRSLTRLLRELLLMHQWNAAAGVIAVLLTAEPGWTERSDSNRCRELKYLPEYRALLEVVLRCQDKLALSFDNVVRLYRKILTRLEVKPTGFLGPRDAAPGNGPLQMELAFFLMNKGEMERAYDTIKPLLLSSLHKHVPIFHVYAGLLQQALWLQIVEADARRLQSDVKPEAAASVRTREYFRLAMGYFQTAEGLEPNSPLIFDLRRQLENAADKLGAAATGGLEVDDQMSREEMVERLTALCEKTHDADCYENLALLLEAATPVDTAALQRCYLELLKVDPAAEAGLQGLRRLHEQGHVHTAVYMEALANHLDTDRGNAQTWGELLGCLESWCAAAKTQPPSTLAPPSANAVNDPTAVSTMALAPPLPLTSAPPTSVLDPSTSSDALPAAAGGAVLSTEQVVSNDKESIRGSKLIEQEAGKSEGIGQKERGQAFGAEFERDRQLAGVQSARQEGEGTVRITDQRDSNGKDGPSDALQGDEGGVLEIVDGAAQEISDTWLWRVDAWRDQHFGREGLEEESAIILSSVNGDRQAGRDQDNAPRGSGSDVRKEVSPGGEAKGGGETEGVLVGGSRGGTDGPENASLDEPLLEQVSRLGSKAGVSAFLSGAENEYTQGVLKLFREEGPGKLGGGRLTRELEARFERAGRCARALGRERRRRDEAHWREVRRRELALKRGSGNRPDVGLKRVGSESGLPGTGGQSADGVSGRVGSDTGLQPKGSLVEEGQRLGGSKTLDAFPGTPKGDQSSEGAKIADKVRNSEELRTANASSAGGLAVGGEVGWGSIEAAVKEEIAGLSTGAQDVGAEQTTTEAGSLETTVNEKGSQLRDEEFDEDGFGVLEIADEWLAAIERERTERDLAEILEKSKREGRKRRREPKRLEKGRAARLGEGRQRREKGKADEESGEASGGGSSEESNNESGEETGRGAEGAKQLTTRQRALAQMREEQRAMCTEWAKVP